MIVFGAAEPVSFAKSFPHFFFFVIVTFFHLLAVFLRDSGCFILARDSFSALRSAIIFSISLNSSFTFFLLLFGAAFVFTVLLVLLAFAETFDFSLAIVCLKSASAGNNPIRLNTEKRNNTKSETKKRISHMKNTAGFQSVFSRVGYTLNPASYDPVKSQMREVIETKKNRSPKNLYMLK